MVLYSTPYGLTFFKPKGPEKLTPNLLAYLFFLCFLLCPGA